MLLLIDNYDSFVHNLARYFTELGCETVVVRNDSLAVRDVERMSPSAIVISPGPCTPNEAGISLDLIRELGPSIPMLGVCLGHQALAAALGGRVIRAQEPVHGRTSVIRHCGTGLFDRLPNPFRATRYHSLIIEESTLPPEWVVTARTDDAESLPMAIEHRQWPLWGVQFHPESVLTVGGRQILSNFLRAAGLSVRPIHHEDWHEPQPPVGIEQSTIGPLHW